MVNGICHQWSNQTWLLAGYQGTFVQSLYPGFSTIVSGILYGPYGNPVPDISL